MCITNRNVKCSPNFHFLWFNQMTVNSCPNLINSDSSLNLNERLERFSQLFESLCVRKFSGEMNATKRKIFTEQWYIILCTIEHYPFIVIHTRKVVIIVVIEVLFVFIYENCIWYYSGLECVWLVNTFFSFKPNIMYSLIRFDRDINWYKRSAHFTLLNT